MFYVIKSCKDELLYIGYTNDLKRRVKEHNNGSNISTKHRIPFELVYYEAYFSKKDAMKRERSLKLRANSFYQLKKRIITSLSMCGGKGEMVPRFARAWSLRRARVRAHRPPE